MKIFHTLRLKFLNKCKLVIRRIRGRFTRTIKLECHCVTRGCALLRGIPYRKAVGERTGIETTLVFRPISGVLDRGVVVVHEHFLTRQRRVRPNSYNDHIHGRPIEMAHLHRVFSIRKNWCLVPLNVRRRRRGSVGGIQRGPSIYRDAEELRKTIRGDVANESSRGSCRL